MEKYISEVKFEGISEINNIFIRHNTRNAKRAIKKYIKFKFPDNKIEKITTSHYSNYC